MAELHCICNDDGGALSKERGTTSKAKGSTEGLRLLTVNSYIKVRL
jgi:hypothetical protein